MERGKVRTSVRKVLADNSNVYCKLISSVFDAWCFCDELGIIHSSTPQLDTLLMPGGEGELEGLPLLGLATTSQERRRAEAFFHGIAKSELPVKIMLSLNRGSSAHQMEVVLTAIALSQAQMDCALTEHPSGNVDSMGDVRLFVAVQVVDAEPLCAVVGPNNEELPPAMKRVRWDSEVEVQEFSEFDKPSTFSAEDPTPGEWCSGSAASVSANLGSLSIVLKGDPLASLPEGARTARLCVRNTFVETIDSDTESSFCHVPSLGRRSAPAELAPVGGNGAAGASSDGKERAPSVGSRIPSARSARSVVSVRTAASRVSRVSRRSRASCLSRATSAWASSVPSTGSADPVDVLLTSHVQDRALATVRVAARLGPAMALSRQGLCSLGSCKHASGECYPCLMQVWYNEGKASEPCKFGKFCGRCHEDHSEAHLTELRRKKRQRGKAKKAHRAL